MQHWSFYCVSVYPCTHMYKNCYIKNIFFFFFYNLFLTHNFLFTFSDLFKVVLVHISLDKWISIVYDMENSIKIIVINIWYILYFYIINKIIRKIMLLSNQMKKISYVKKFKKGTKEILFEK